MNHSEQIKILELRVSSLERMLKTERQSRLDAENDVDKLHCIVKQLMVDPLPLSTLAFPDGSLERSGLSTRSYQCLRRNGVHTVASLIKTTDDQIRLMLGAGKKSVDEIKKLRDDAKCISEVQK